MRTENWHGNNIRFVDIDGEWWAILKDICDALNLHTFKVSQRLDSDMLKRVRINVSNTPSKYNRSRGDNEYRWMLAVNEDGIYEALYASRKLEARQFRKWSSSVMKKLRKWVGLEGYEVMQMTEPDVQDEINDVLDTLFYDEETKMLMTSITVQGGDIEVVPFEGDDK